MSDMEYETGVYEDIDVSEDELEWQQAKILDISGGGVRLIQKTHLEKNELIKIKFEMGMVGEIMKFNLFARILSSTIMNNQTGLMTET